LPQVFVVEYQQLEQLKFDTELAGVGCIALVGLEHTEFSGLGKIELVEVVSKQLVEVMYIAGFEVGQDERVRYTEYFEV
jgi:hypothetical protein